MKSWTKLFPLCFIEWFSKKHCEVWIDGMGRKYVRPFTNVRMYLFDADRKAAKTNERIAELEAALRNQCDFMRKIGVEPSIASQAALNNTDKSKE